jgi:hypothetical protein
METLLSKKAHVPVSIPTTPTSVSQTPHSLQKSTSVSAPYSPHVDHMVKSSLEKTPAKIPFPSPSVPHVSHGESDCDIEDYSLSPAVKPFPEDQEHALNFIVEGCVFRGDLEISTPPPSDSRQEDSLTEYDGRPWKDVRIPSPGDDPRAAWERNWNEEEARAHARDEAYDSKTYLPAGQCREPSPEPEHYIPSAAFTKSGKQERSNTPPDDFDRYLVESFRPVTKALLPATTTPFREVAGAAMSSRVVVPSVDIVPRRLSYSDGSAILRAHGERDPDLGAVSDADFRCDDDYSVDPGDWQDQSLYDTELLQHVDASHSPCSSHGGQDSDASSSCGLQPNRDDYSDTSSFQSDHYDSDGCSDV